MKPVLQTRFGQPLGNCWAACIASILELPLEAVDWSADMTADEIWKEGWEDVSPEWLARRDKRLSDLGYFMARQDWTPELEMPPGVHYMVLGRLTSGVGHVCVYRDGKLAHDPHPGVQMERIEEISFLVRR